MDLRDRKQQNIRENYIMWSSIISILHQILLVSSNRNNMGGACSTHGNLRSVFKPLDLNPNERYDVVYQSVFGTIILKCML